MNDPTIEGLSWNDLTWQDIQAIGAALAERHPGEKILSLAPERLAELVAALPGFEARSTRPDEFTLSAVATAWIAALEGDDDSSPYENLA